MFEMLLFGTGVLLLVRHRFFWRARQHPPLPKFMAHRGMKTRSPENTLASYQDAIDQGFRAIELDIVSTQDGKLVCSHNFDLERETSGDGWIHQKNCGEIDSVKTGVNSHPNNPQQIPLFSEAIQHIPKDIFLNIEIKTHSLFDLSTAKQLIRIIKTNDINHAFMVSSFNPVVVAYFRLFCPNVSVGFICQDIEWVWISHWIHPDYFHPRGDLVTHSMLQMSERHRLPFNVWTVNTEPAIRWCLKNNLSSIITDNPKATHV